MENKPKKNKNILNFLTIGLIVICIVLLVMEIGTNTIAELRVNQSQESHSIVIDSLVDGE